MRKLIPIACLAAGVWLAGGTLLMQYGGMEGKSDSFFQSPYWCNTAGSAGGMRGGGTRIGMLSPEGKAACGMRRDKRGIAVPLLTEKNPGGLRRDKDKIQPGEGNREKYRKYRMEEWQAWDGGALEERGRYGGYGGKRGAAGTGRRAGTPLLAEVFQGEGIRHGFREEDYGGISYISFCREWWDGRDGTEPVTIIRIVRKN